MVFTQEELAYILDAIERHCADLRRMEDTANKYGDPRFATKIGQYDMFGIHVHAKVRDLFNRERSNVNATNNVPAL